MNKKYSMYFLVTLIPSLVQARASNPKPFTPYKKLTEREKEHLEHKNRIRIDKERAAKENHFKEKKNAKKTKKVDALVGIKKLIKSDLNNVKNKQTQ